MSDSDKSKIPWWAFWQKWRVWRKSRKHSTQTKELDSFKNWDVKTNPLAVQPKSSVQTPTPPRRHPAPSAAVPQPRNHPPPQPTANPAAQTKPPTLTALTEFFGHRSPSDWCFGLLFVAFMAAYSTPLWLVDWPPISEATAQMGLLAHSRLPITPTANSPIQSQPLLFIGIGGDLLLREIFNVLPSKLAFSILLQLLLLSTILSFGLLLRWGERSRWNIFLAFVVFYSAALYSLDLNFFLAMPLILLGFGAMHNWLVQRGAWQGFMAVAISWSLLFLQLEAYLLFVVGVFCLCLLSNANWKDRFFDFIMPASSLLLFVPWCVFLIGMDPQLISLPHYAALYDRLYQLFDFALLTTHTTWNALICMALLLTLLLGIAANVPAQTRPTPSSHRGHIFAPLAIVMLLIYFALPDYWQKYTIVTTSPLVLAYLAFIGWIQIDPSKAVGRLLIALSLAISGGYSAQLIYAYRLYNTEQQQLQNLLRFVPTQQRLLVWKMPHSKALKLHYAQVGGIYMKEKRGISNIDLTRQLKWKWLHYDSKRNIPLPNRKSLPNLRHWDYLLTAERLKPDHPQLKIIAHRGQFLLYQTQRP
jgi:hypothetical protein